MKARYRTSEKWASETDWLGNQPLGANAGGVIDTTLAFPDAVAEEEDKQEDQGHASNSSQGFETSAVVTGMVGGLE